MLIAKMVNFNNLYKTSQMHWASFKKCWTKLGSNSKKEKK